jgi:hypothetical protein
MKVQMVAGEEKRGGERKMRVPKAAGDEVKKGNGERADQRRKQANAKRRAPYDRQEGGEGKERKSRVRKPCRGEGVANLASKYAQRIKTKTGFDAVEDKGMVYEQDEAWN